MGRSLRGGVEGWRDMCNGMLVLSYDTVAIRNGCVQCYIYSTGYVFNLVSFLCRFCDFR